MRTNNLRTQKGGGRKGLNAVMLRAKEYLAVPESFRQTALGFPAKVDKALALIDDSRAAKELLDRADAMAHYANRIKADTEIVNSIQYGKLKIVARLAELIPAPTPNERGAKGGRGHKAPPPDGVAFGHTTKAKFRKVGAHKPKIDDYYRQALHTKNGDPPAEMSMDGFIRFATGTEKAGQAAHVSANTGIPEWYTPDEYLEAARQVLGCIELDPASTDIAQERVKADRYFTLDNDGLAHPWAGRVWLNPPYAADLIKKFISKLCDHLRAGDVPEAIVLTNNATETSWFQSAGHLATALCLPAGRIKFPDEQGHPGGPLQGQSILYFGDRAERFVGEFEKFGLCWVRRAGNSALPRSA